MYEIALDVTGVLPSYKAKMLQSMWQESFLLYEEAYYYCEITNQMPIPVALRSETYTCSLLLLGSRV
jgi:hypothetical protein